MVCASRSKRALGRKVQVRIPDLITDYGITSKLITTVYRLKFSFVNVGHAGMGSRDRPSATVTKGRTPILAACFSSPFQVYSAKKFPGVWESTALSKVFATQGIKIPIRKDGGKGGDNEELEEAPRSRD